MAMKREYKAKLDASKFKVTSQGFLQCDANLTRAGVFTYFDSKGKPVRELRPEEEVFKQQSMDSLKLAPFTDTHQGMLDSDTAKDKLIGGIGENIRQDGEFVVGLVQVIDKDTVKKIFDRKELGLPLEVSCGYDAREDRTPGVHPVHGAYDLIQRDITYNHVSLVSAGRAGPDVRLKLDNKEKEKKVMLKFKKDGVRLARFVMDSIEAEVDDASIATLDRLSGKLDEAIKAITAADSDVAKEVAKLDTLQGKFDALVAESDKLKKQVTDLSDPNSEAVQSMIADKAKLDAACKHFNVEVAGKEPLELKKAVVKAHSDSCDFVGKSEEYVNARFDATLEAVDTSKKSDEKVLKSRFKTQSKTDGDHLSPRERFSRESAAAGREKGK